MDPTLFSDLSLIATLILIIFSVIVFIKTNITSKSNLPPGKFGWPLYGETIDYITHPEKFMHDKMTKYSPEIFKTSILGEKVAILCGPLANKFIFSNDGKLFKFWMPPSLASALSSQDIDHNSPSSKYLLEQLHKFLRLESLQHLVPIMDSKAHEYFDTYWAPFEQVNVHPLTKDFTFTLTCYLFVKYGKEEQVKGLSKPFFELHEGTMSKSVSLPFYSVRKKQQRVQKKILSIIKERELELESRENEGGDCDGFRDLLSRVLMASREDGIVLDDKDVVGKINSLLFASFYTISTAITFMVYYLADHPHVYDKVLQEHLEIAKGKEAGELLNWKDIQKMKYSWSVACETMRLRPPALGSFREVVTDFTYAGFRVPKGWKVAWNVYSSHKDPKYFPDPDKFDPTRFEGNNKIPLPPYAYVPFGGGPLMCGGKEYARIEILVFLHNLVTRFKFSKANPEENIIYTPVPTPVQGLPLRLHKFDLLH